CARDGEDSNYDFHFDYW
nr:immunoglobulin heavy chain junction region [Macaca mulatta]MOW75516.1 immunoglobulin heavy chain junction region [Macaca mulatta]MOW76332.1 immunoglobulin heavy chain junction region [Macaca mulatta]MOW77510.1 immunoglobulin heavy chain junction region [Macaca mulatta]MOW78300.1 immunoglobulin heavy chain junction region [Macaca mulatta]